MEWEASLFTCLLSLYFYFQANEGIAWILATKKLMEALEHCEGDLKSLGSFGVK